MATVIAAQTTQAMMPWFAFPVITKKKRENKRMTNTINDLEKALIKIL